MVSTTPLIPEERAANALPATHALVRAGLINPLLDLGAAAAEFARAGVVQVADVLRAPVAEVLHDCLAREVPWSLAYRDAAGPHKLWAEELTALTPTGRQSLETTILGVARRGFSFCYDSFMLVTAYKEKRHPELVLHRLLEQLNSPPWLDAMRRITGLAAIRRSDGQATRYLAGHFLRQHNDMDEDVGRLCAYVINLTREWSPDWGGLLQFIDDEGAVTRTLMPRFNSLSLFRVPSQHCVSPVAPFATGARYAITGWLLR